MEKKSRYNTRQKESITEFFKENPGVHLTANDVCEKLGIGQATVYRRLESLVDEEIINKYILDKNSPACFEYAGDHKGNKCHHMKCTGCGRLIHLTCDELDNLVSHIKKDHDFELDLQRTVFYGLCSDCKGGPND